jgi:hypothetical protein
MILMEIASLCGKQLARKNQRKHNFQPCAPTAGCATSLCMRDTLFARSLPAALGAPNLGLGLTELAGFGERICASAQQGHAVGPRLPVQNQQEKANKLTHI